MGGGDLNMKKSWHPLLKVNQERVWKREKEALEERKKLEELRREREQEREMQELQRLQEAAGGKKRVDKVDWMYATPAAQGGPSANELEDYLLGKKRVDKLLKGDEAEKVSKHDTSNFISLQNANTSKDTAAKIREDPMLAIKQQEQAAYEALLRDPTRLRQMRAKAGLDPGNSESKEERRRRKEEKRRRKEERYADRDHRSSRSDEWHYESHSRDAGHESSDRRDRDRDRDRDRNRDRDGDHRDHRSERDDRRDRERHHSAKDRHRDDEARDRRSYDHSRRDYRHDSDRYDRTRGSRSRSRSPRVNRNGSRESDGGDRRLAYAKHRGSGRTKEEDVVEAEKKEAERQARLEAMMADARSLDAQRTEYVARVNAEESAEAKREEELREKLMKAKQKGAGDGKGSFLLDQQRKVFGDDVELAERMRRGRGGLQKLD